MLWQLCLASVKLAGTIQVSLAMSKTIPENSLKFGTKVILLKYAAKLIYRPYPCSTTSYNNPGLASQYTRSSSCIHTILNFAFLLMVLALILAISLSEELVYTIYTCPSYLGSKMIVSNHFSNSSSNSKLVAHWPAAYNTPALPTIEALASVSGTKGELHGGLDKESRTVSALLGI